MPVTVSFRQIRTGGALTIPIVYFLTVTRLSGRTIFLQASKMDSRPRTGPRGSAIWHSCVTLIVIPGPAVSIDFNWKKKAAHATRRLKQFEDGNPSSTPAGILSYPSTISP